MNVAGQRTLFLRRFVYNFFLIFCTIFLLTSCESKKKIVYGLNQNEANEILVFLASKNIDAEKEKSTDGGTGGGSKVLLWDILVNSADSNEAMRQLNQQGLPRVQGKSVLDIFSTGGLVSSDLSEKIKYRAALAAQLASTIRKYEGVLDADVQVSFPEEDPLNPGKTKGRITASIWVKHSGILDDPNSHLATKVKRYVASAITGLNYDDVNLVSERSRVGDMSEEGQLKEDDKQLVNVWSLTLAKDSISRFRWIFFSFITTLLLLGLSLVWIIWKILPLLNRYGGLKALLSIKALPLDPLDESDSESLAKEADEQDGKDDKGKDSDKDVDET